MKKNKRALFKTFTWRALASTDTFIISLIVIHYVSNPLAIASTIATVEIINKLFLYYFHERVWQRFGS